MKRPRVIQFLSDSRRSNKTILAILCILVTGLTVEISLVRTYNLTGNAPLSMFLIMTILYVVGQYYILEFVGRKLEEMGVKKVFQFTIHKVVKLLQYLLSIILVVLFLQMLLTSYYYSMFLALVTKTIRGLTTKESKLLDSIGTAQMEQEIEKRVLSLTKQNKDRLAEETGIQSSLTEEDMKQYLEEVISEVKMQKRTTGKTNGGNA